MLLLQSHTVFTVPRYTVQYVESNTLVFNSKPLHSVGQRGDTE